MVVTQMQPSGGAVTSRLVTTTSASATSIPMNRQGVMHRSLADTYAAAQSCDAGVLPAQLSGLMPRSRRRSRSQAVWGSRMDRAVIGGDGPSHLRAVAVRTRGWQFGRFQGVVAMIARETRRRSSGDVGGVLGGLIRARTSYQL